ncbi:MAG: phage shock protein PspA [Sphingomonadales bacterium]|jgi:phage shock protein A
MGIFSRLTDIINSNINDVLDRAEDPEKMIRLVIQEMEDTLVEVRSSAAKTIADQKDMRRQLKRMGDAMSSWEEKAELAISKGREDLAKGALVEKAKVAQMAKALEEELALLDDAIGKHEEDIIKLEAKLREAKAKQAAILARAETATNRLKIRQHVYSSRVDDAFARFERVERRVDATEGRIEALDMGRGKSLDEELAELEAEESVTAELEALKAKLTKDKGEKKAPKSK